MIVMSSWNTNNNQKSINLRRANNSNAAVNRA